MATPKVVLKLSTAVKIQTVLSENNPDSVSIKIEDPYETVKVDNLAMTQVASNTYQYVWQSATTDQEGDYRVTISAVFGSYTSVDQVFFTLEDID